MSTKTTNAELFELAIAVERTAEELYRGLEAKFADCQEVADFWREYAAEEVGHAQWLEHLRDTSSPERLSAPADPAILRDVHEILQFSTQNALKRVKSLEDAYQLVHEFENSETNAIFEFLITNFSSDKETRAFLRSQLNDHLSKLMTEFPMQFKHITTRRAIKALEQTD
jgi:rubrerythrin